MMPPFPPSYRTYEGAFHKMEQVEKPDFKEQCRLIFHRWYQASGLDGTIWVFKVMDNKIYYKEETCWKNISLKQYKESFGIPTKEDDITVKNPGRPK